MLDLRECQFIRPAAVLWCTVFPLLVRLSSLGCTVMVPKKLGVCVYLKSIGLIGILKQYGVKVDNRDIPEQTDPQVILPLARFDNESQVEELTNQANETLHDSGLASANLYPLVSETFGELAMNAVQHSESPIGAFGFIQFYGIAGRRRFVCGVADGGIGIRRSLAKNPDLVDLVPYDWVAVERATRERVSGTGDTTRGIGLYGVAEDMRKGGRQLIIHSGIGWLRISERIESQARRSRPFPGTLAYASIRV